MKLDAVKVCQEPFYFTCRKRGTSEVLTEGGQISAGAACLPSLQKSGTTPRTKNKKEEVAVTYFTLTKHAQKSNHKIYYHKINLMINLMFSSWCKVAQLLQQPEMKLKIVPSEENIYQFIQGLRGCYFKEQLSYAGLTMR